ncbi:MAG: hypothetical protein IPI85_04695 [Dehalococcoidia bacterium]|nr:hypothetical protein [Dehalococcoidia bacterium]
MQYLRARYYDPETGTFLSREPMALSAGWIGHPTGYGANNPVRMTDATGLVPTDSNGCALADHGCQDRAAADEEKRPEGGLLRHVPQRSIHSIVARLPGRTKE